jgi:hypothetical protein
MKGMRLMPRLAVLGAVAATALSVAVAAGAAPNSATTIPGIDPVTNVTSTPVAGGTFYVKFTVFGTQPVVPYEYALQNTCVYPPKPWGHYTLGQHDAIATWTDSDSQHNPQVTMPVYLQSVPAGSTCRVSLMDNNTVVKGSTYSYTVG